MRTRPGFCLRSRLLLTHRCSAVSTPHKHPSWALSSCKMDLESPAQGHLHQPGTVASAPPRQALLPLSFLGVRGRSSGVQGNPLSLKLLADTCLCSVGTLGSWTSRGSRYSSCLILTFFPAASLLCNEACAGWSKAELRLDLGSNRQVWRHGHKGSPLGVSRVSMTSQAWHNQNIAMPWLQDTFKSTLPNEQRK